MYRVPGYKDEYQGITFGGLEYWDRDSISNTVYIKGKDKIVYWSTLDGAARGATYKQLPALAHLDENPAAVFEEEDVLEGQFPASERGAATFKAFAEYIQDAGTAGELRESAVFNSSDEKNSKHVTEWMNISPNVTAPVFDEMELTNGDLQLMIRNISPFATTRIQTKENLLDPNWVDIDVPRGVTDFEWVVKAPNPPTAFFRAVSE